MILTTAALRSVYCLIFTIGAIVSFGESYLIKPEEKQACNAFLSPMETYSSTENAWGDAKYYIFSYDASNEATKLTGANSKVSKGTEVDAWCLQSGSYIGYLASNTESNTDADFGVKICNKYVLKPEKFVMFSVDSFGDCVISFADEIALNDNSRKTFSVKEAVTLSYDFSADFSTSLPLSGEFSADFSQAITETPTLVPTDAPTFTPTAVPTVTPTDAPTFTPTAVPTVTPTFEPTFEPTFVPSSTPTFVPSSSPTLIPTTSTPSFRPSQEPTTIYSTLEMTAYNLNCYSDCKIQGDSTPVSSWTKEQFCTFYAQSGCTEDEVGDYDCSPSCLNDCPDAFCSTFSTLVYSCQVPGVYADKTELDGECLASYGEEAQTTTQIVFTTDMGFDGVSAETMLNDAAAQNAAIFAMAESMSGVPANQISILSIVDAARRKLIIEELATGCKINFQILAILEQLGYTQNQADQAYQSLTSQISSSVSSGQFKSLMQVSYDQQTGGNSSTLDNLAVDDVVFGEYEVTILATAPPTTQPTTHPDSSTDDKELSDGEIAGITIGVIAFVVIVAVICYFVFVRSQNEKLEREFNKKLSSRRGGSETSDDPRDDDKALTLVSMKEEQHRKSDVVV